MGVRESMSKRPTTAAAIAVVLVLAAIAFAFFRIFDVGEAPGGTSDSERAFFTVDDGKTWFIDDASQLAPFQHDGKDAVRAYVVECNSKRYVNHLERYTPEGKQAMLRLREAVKTGPPPGSLVAAAQQRGREVKRPGDATWTIINTPAGDAIVTLKAPPGASGEPTVIFP
jgi:hypothetical protein